jgi:glycosyltransferase involved in cell wall biosynthesis
MTPFGKVRSSLTWNNPVSWYAAGRRAASADLLVITVTTPVQVPALLEIRRAAGRRPRVVALVHNVLPHERKPWDELLVRRLLRRVDAVLVHSEAQRDLAARFTDAPIAVTKLPGALEGAALGCAAPARLSPRTSADAPLRVLAFGMVRPYKGVDVLLRAAALVPQVHVIVAGEFWSPEAETRELIGALGIAQRTEVISGYIPSARVPSVFERADVVALTYRQVSGSGNLNLALTFARPVVVSRIGALAEAVADGNWGLTVEPGDVDCLAATLTRLAQPEVYNRLAKNAAAAADQADGWDAYVRALSGAGGPMA